MGDSTPEKVASDDILRMSVDMVAAYLSNNAVPTNQVTEVINTVYRSLDTVNGNADNNGELQKPAVSIRKSVTPDFIICLEDGKKLKMLKRHLMTAYGMTPEDYRAKWKLPADYPMVSPNYAKKRSEFAKKIGLGQKTGPKKKRK